VTKQLIAEVSVTKQSIAKVRVVTKQSIADCPHLASVWTDKKTYAVIVELCKRVRLCLKKWVDVLVFRW